MLESLITSIQENSNITENLKVKLIILIKQKKDAFGTLCRHLMQTNLLKFRINTGDAKPIMRRPYQGMSLSEQAHLKKDYKKWYTTE